MGMASTQQMFIIIIAIVFVAIPFLVYWLRSFRHGF